MNCNGRIIDTTNPKVMGILNLTPNSFYDGGHYKTDIEILNKVEQMLADGADFIDVGAYSSKPNAAFVSENIERARMIPIIKIILKHFPDVVLSIDTFRAAVAQACIENGAGLINDIYAGNQDFRMLETISQYKVPYIMMHIKGTPQTMQSLAQYDDIVKEILFYFSERVALARSLGIADLIVDPGFGFAKTTEHNFEILKKLELLQLLELPILVGISRKSMIYKTLKTNPNEALNGTTVLNTIALSKGAKILRVHDVKEAVACIKLFSLC